MIATPPNAVVRTKRFIAAMFIIGTGVGLLSAGAFMAYLKSLGKWDSAQHVFPSMLLFWGMAFVFPCLTISLRVMYLSLVMNFEAIQNYEKLVLVIDDTQKKVDPIVTKINSVVDKMLPMSDNVQVVLEKAKNMSADVVEIAHRVRSATEQMNGSFNVKALEGKLDTLAASLSTIASVFKPLAKTDAQADGGNGLPFSLTALDPLKMGGKRRG